MIVKNDLFDYKNRYIYQESDGFKFSLDSILLAEFSMNNSSNKKILDLCSGNAAIPLIMSCYNKSQYYAFEIQNDIYKLGLDSILLNKLEKQINIINDDVNNIGRYFNKDYFDIITCNPPFFKVNDKKTININEKKAVARHEISFHLEDAFKIARDYLKNGGSLNIVLRCSRIDELFIYATKYNVNIKKIQLISTKKDEKPSIILVKCIKNSKMGVVVNKEICVQDLKSYQNLFKE